MSHPEPPAVRERWTGSAEETETAGAQLGRQLTPGRVLLLEGPLGAGKTTFVRGLARGLGARGHVSSPTYQLLRVYDGPIPLAHADLYRMVNAEAELGNLGVEELLEQGVLVVEWGDRLSRWPGAVRIAFTEPDAGAPERRRLSLQEAPASWSW